MPILRLVSTFKEAMEEEKGKKKEEKALINIEFGSIDCTCGCTLFNGLCVCMHVCMCA